MLRGNKSPNGIRRVRLKKGVKEEVGGSSGNFCFKECLDYVTSTLCTSNIVLPSRATGMAANRLEIL